MAAKGSLRDERYAEDLEALAKKNRMPGLQRLQGGSKLAGIGALIIIITNISTSLFKPIAVLAIVVVPIGYLIGFFGLTLILHGVLGVMFSKPVTWQEGIAVAIPRTTVQLTRARVLVSVCAPLLLVLHPAAWNRIISNLPGFVVMPTAFNIYWSIAQAAVLITGVLFAAIAKASAKDSVPIYAAAGLLSIAATAEMVLFA